MTHHEAKLSQLLRNFFQCDDAEQELVTEQIKSLVREPQQIKGDSGVRAKLPL